MITVKWGNNLTELADAMFGEMDPAKVANPSEIFSHRQCIVIPNRIMQSWVQHQYLFRGEDSSVPRVLANCDFPLLNVFVNDWLDRMDHPDGQGRDPAQHPFALESLSWRIYRALDPAAVKDDPRFKPLHAFMTPAGGESRQTARRRYKLASRLSALFDEYVVYRPEMLARWELKPDGALPDALSWEPALWRILTAGDLRKQTYLAAFIRMAAQGFDCGIANTYRCVRVFGASMMPRIYLLFFDWLSEALPVHFHVFNPCSAPWFDHISPKERERAQRRARLEGLVDAGALFEPGNPLLGALGRGCRDFTAEVLDLTGGQAEAEGRFHDPGQDSVLHAVQSAILANTPPDEQPPLLRSKVPDDSVQFHRCHNPMREVEVLKDYILRCFAESPDLQPRQVQVQVSDMATYAPLIDAVFATQALSLAQTIPYAIADRVLAGESLVAEAFNHLLELADSRFTAPDVMGLLRCDSIREAFGFGEQDVDDLRGWIESAGVKWGRDAEHRTQEVSVKFTEATTWRHGLDRLLLGYALGRSEVESLSTGPCLPCDCVEGDDAVTVGRLARFVDGLGHAADVCRGEKTPAEWARQLDALVTTFFASTNETFHDVHVLRGAIEAIRKSATAAELGDEVQVPAGVIRDCVARHLQGVIGGDDLVGNAVVFSALRPGSSAPRRIMCLLGMGDGLFPRSENRPAYDLFRVDRKRGDRSQRIEDRMAFLEAVSHAGERLYISYTGYSSDDNELIPSSVLVKELREYLEKGWGPGCYRQVDQKLQPFHPDYFNDGSALFSYSRSNCLAAKAQLKRMPRADIQTAVLPAPCPVVPWVGLDDVIAFFKNPAQAYYRNVLDVRLEPRDAGALEDSEEFAPGGVVAYDVNARIVESLLGDEPANAERIYRELSECGQVPLAGWGQRWFARRWEELDTILKTPIKEWGGLGLALKAQRNGASVDGELLVSQATTVSGKTVCAVRESGSPVAVDFRCVKPQAFGMLSSWVRHLFACASGIPEIRLWVEGKAADALRVISFMPVPQEQALECLGRYVDTYRRGLHAVPPFSPAMSHACATALRKAKKNQAKPRAGSVADVLDPDAHVRTWAVEAARKKWFSDDYHAFNDSRDPYYQAAFGPNGPFADERAFVDLAEAVFGPMLDAAEISERPG